MGPNATRLESLQEGEICDFPSSPVVGTLHFHCLGHGGFFVLFWFGFYFIYLFLAALGPRHCAWALSSCGEQGPLLVAVRGLLIVVSSLVAEHWL